MRHRFGIMNTDAENSIFEFEEKPAKHAKNNKASMGVYIFRWDKLLKYLTEDAQVRRDPVQRLSAKTSSPICWADSAAYVCLRF